MFRGSLFSGLWRPKNPHSLEQLKYLHNVLQKNQTVSESNRGMLVETLRSIAEILIWGDQNDSAVFDFYLEKNMLAFFLRILNQKCGNYVCVQILQTLNIMFENIRSRTSIYYLLSNNHINSIIVHKFDLNDEEVMAYYISLLKTLSLKLNQDTVQFFYNQHTNDFPLYTEAIKFFNHSEPMVRIAARTLTLNVFRVNEKCMLKFVCEHTAQSYFFNLARFIGSHVLDLDSCVACISTSASAADNHNNNVAVAASRQVDVGRLADLVAEHLDNIHYINDILSLNVDDLNQILTQHLLNNLLLPLYVFPLAEHFRAAQTGACRGDATSRTLEMPRCASVVVCLFLLSQVFLVLTHQPLVRLLARVILSGAHVHNNNTASQNEDSGDRSGASTGDVVPQHQQYQSSPTLMNECCVDAAAWDSGAICAANSVTTDACVSDGDGMSGISVVCNYTDEEKRLLSATMPLLSTPSNCVTAGAREEESRDDRRGQPVAFMAAILSALDCSQNGGDHSALFALSLVYTIGRNSGINSELLESVLLSTWSGDRLKYNHALVDKVVDVIVASCEPESRVRLVTLQLAISVLDQLTLSPLPHSACHSPLSDEHLARLERATEQATLNVRNFYKLSRMMRRYLRSNGVRRSRVQRLTQWLSRCGFPSRNSFVPSEEIFLDMFDDECERTGVSASSCCSSSPATSPPVSPRRSPLFNIELLLMDDKLLLAPSCTPLSGVRFDKRLPCGEVERAGRAIAVFLQLRRFICRVRCRVAPDDDEASAADTGDRRCCCFQRHLAAVCSSSSSSASVRHGDTLDLNNSDLIACTLCVGGGDATAAATRGDTGGGELVRTRRFLVIDCDQMLLVDPDPRRLGWGVVRFAGRLTDTEVTADVHDSRLLHVTVRGRRRAERSQHTRRRTPPPSVDASCRTAAPAAAAVLLSGRLVFDDHIRCMAARRKLTRGRHKARQRRMQAVGALLDLPAATTVSVVALGGGRSSPPSSRPVSSVVTETETVTRAIQHVHLHD